MQHFPAIPSHNPATLARVGLLISTALGSALAGCAGLGLPDQASFAPPQSGDQGVVIASSALVSAGTALGRTPSSATPADCSGPGLGVLTSSARGSQNLLLDAEGDPCGTATMLFDGRQTTAQRAADPGIRISLHPALYGNRPGKSGLATHLAEPGFGMDGFDAATDNLLNPLPPKAPGAPTPGGLQPLPSASVRTESLSALPAAVPAGGRSLRTGNEEKMAELAKLTPAAGQPLALLNQPATPVTKGIGAPVGPALNGSAVHIGTQLGNAAIPPAAPATPPANDQLASLLGSWRAREGARARAGDEASAAAARNLENTVEKRQLTQAQRQASELLLTLREKERQLEAERQRHEQTRQLALQQQTAATSTLSTLQQQEQQYTSALNASRDKLSAYESLNERLAQEKATTEKLYQQRLQTMAADLKSAESQASRERNQLVLQAAQKIAEAEQIANAARLSEADAQARAAERQKQAAEAMLASAIQLKNNQAVAAAASIKPSQPAQMALLEVPVVVHAKDQTLQDILNQVVAQAKPQAGDWTPDWQIPVAQRTMLQDKWSLTAEAPVDAVLKNLAAQVESARGLRLRFTQFPQSRMLVVTTEAAK